MNNPLAGDYNWDAALKALLIFLATGFLVGLLTTISGTLPALAFGVPLGLALVIWAITLMFLYSEKADPLSK